MNTRNAPRQPRGISLIEALVALAIMAIGMLGIVGVQSTLRSTSDLAKQRSEAVRIAQIEIERWRAFITIAGGAGTNYNDLPAGGPVASPPITGVNATYTLNRTVTLLPDPRRGKALAVNVTWEDRSGQPQRVDLSTLIAGISPELGHTLIVPGAGDVIQQPLGRKGGIPIGAKDLGGGRSGWIPPGSGTGIAWVFNNITGTITLCTTTATAIADLVYNPNDPTYDNVICGTNQALYVGGFVRYALDFAQPTPANAANPPSPPSSPPASDQVTVEVLYTLSGFDLVQPCYVRHYSSGSSLPSYSEFSCAVPALVIPGVPLSWTGTLSFGPGAVISTTSGDAASTRMKVCRYHPEASYGAQTAPLANQNFLFIRSGDGGSPAVPYVCPSPLFAHQPL